MNLESHHQQHQLIHNLPKANYVDLQQYLGDWYILAHIPTPFEAGAINAIESYKWNEQDKRIDIDYHYNLGDPNGPMRHFNQKAWITDPKTNAEWKVQFVWPFKFKYRVLEVAPDYSWALVGNSSRNFIWVMSRKSSLAEPIYEELIQKLEAWQYDITKLRKVPQIWDLG